MCDLKVGNTVEVVDYCEDMDRHNIFPGKTYTIVAINSNMVQINSGCLYCSNTQKGCGNWFTYRFRKVEVEKEDVNMAKSKVNVVTTTKIQSVDLNLTEEEAKTMYLLFGKMYGNHKLHQYTYSIFKKLFNLGFRRTKHRLEDVNNCDSENLFLDDQLTDVEFQNKGSK